MKGKYIYDYPHPAVTTDCVIFGYDTKEGLSVLLVKRGIEPFKDCWAFPGGFIRMDEDTETGARRELKEETGYSADEMIYLGEFYPTCAYSDEVIHMYLAKGLATGEQKLDDDEFVGVEKMPLEEAVNEIMKGNIPDGKTQTAILKAYLWLKDQ